MFLVKKFSRSSIVSFLRLRTLSKLWATLRVWVPPPTCCSTFATATFPSLTVLTDIRLFHQEGRSRREQGEKVRQSSCEFSALNIIFLGEVRSKLLSFMIPKLENFIHPSLPTFLFLFFRSSIMPSLPTSPLPCSYPRQSQCATGKNWPVNIFILSYFPRLVI